MKARLRSISRRRFTLLLAVSTVIAMVAPVAAGADGTFTDDDGSVFESDIEWLAAEEITKGCNPPTNDQFCPNDHVTRGQMAAFLVRALGYTDDGGGDLFIDDDGSIFEADIDKLGAAGISRGCNPPTNDQFCPNDHVTRGQMAAFLVRALGYTDDGGGDLFIDDDGSIFEADIDRLGTAGVTLGCNPPVNDQFCPNDRVTRGQMAAFLKRALYVPPANQDVAAYFANLRTWAEDPDEDHLYLEFKDEPRGDWADWEPYVSDPDVVCRQRDFDLQNTPEEIVTFDQKTEFLWPGVLLEGDTYSGGIGTIKELPIRQRAPVSVFVNFSRGDIRRVVVDPTPGKIAAAVGDIIEQADNASYEPGTSVYFEQHETHSAEQMGLHLGLSAKYMGSSVKSSLDMARTAEENTLTVYFKETAFTAQMEQPQFPGEFFSGEFTPALLQEQKDLLRIADDNLPVYVSGVTYGRILIYSITSTASLTEIKAALEGVYDGGLFEAEAEVKAEYAELIAQSRTELVTVGGSSLAASAAIASGSFKDYFTEAPSLSQYVPISYVIKDLHGNVAYLGETTDYKVEECEGVPDELRVRFVEARLFEAGNPDGYVGLNRFFLYAQAYNRQDDADIPGTPLYGSANWCAEDPATDGSEQSVEEVFCEYTAGTWPTQQGDTWGLGPGREEYLDIPFDNSAAAGGTGAWPSNTLQLRATARDWTHGRQWTQGWSELLTGADIMGLEDGEYVFRINEGPDTWDIKVSFEPAPPPDA